LFDTGRDRQPFGSPALEMKKIAATHSFQIEVIYKNHTCEDFAQSRKLLPQPHLLWE
jgi:hypothetical protein